MLWDCIEMSMFVSEKKQMRMEKAKMRYEEWYEKREKKKQIEIEAVVQELLSRVMYTVTEKNLKRKVLIDLEEKWRKCQDKKEMEMSGIHLVRKRKQ